MPTQRRDSCRSAIAAKKSPSLVAPSAASDETARKCRCGRRRPQHDMLSGGGGHHHHRQQNDDNSGTASVNKLSAGRATAGGNAAQEQPQSIPPPMFTTADQGEPISLLVGNPAEGLDVRPHARDPRPAGLVEHRRLDAQEVDVALEPHLIGDEPEGLDHPPQEEQLRGGQEVGCSVPIRHTQRRDARSRYATTAPPRRWGVGPRRRSDAPGGSP